MAKIPGTTKAVLQMQADRKTIEVALEQRRRSRRLRAKKR